MRVTVGRAGSRRLLPLIVATLLAGCAADGGASTAPMASAPPAPSSTPTSTAPTMAATDTTDTTFTTVPAPIDLAQLAGVYYLPTSIEGYERPAGSAMRLWFHEGRVAAYAGCNTVSARASVDQGHLHLTEFSATLAGCSAEGQAEEAWLSDLLLSSPTISVDGPTVRLESPGTIVEFTDEEIADPDVPLEGRPWLIETIQPPPGTPPSGAMPFDVGTLRFDDGVLHADIGCALATAAYERALARLTVDPLVWTDDGCDETGRRTAVDAALGEQLVLDIAANRMRLEAADGTIVYLHTPR